MEGVIDLAEEIFHMPVRSGMPQHVTGLVDVVRNPIHATGVGLLLYGYQHHSEQRKERSADWGGKSLWTRMKSWFQGNF
jgi:cell division protein FtsA